MKNLGNYTDLKSLVDDFGGIDSFHFRVCRDKYSPIKTAIIPTGTYTDEWIDCRISSFENSLLNGNCVKVVPSVDDRFEFDMYEQSVLLSFIKSGLFVLP